jgi:DNA-binding response OmpR family regulator
MAHLSRTERLRLIRALKAAGEHHLADRFADRGGPVKQDGLVIRSLRLHVQSSTLAIGDREVEVPPAVTELLVTLSTLAGTPIGRTDLADVLDSWPARISVLVTHARRALGRLAGDGRDVLHHDREGDTYWLSASWPLLVVA